MAARRTSVVWPRTPPPPSQSSLSVVIQPTTTKRDDDDLVGGWRGGGEDECQPLHREAVDHPATADHRHCLPGYWLDNQ